MEDLAFIKERIPSYAGYADEVDRHLVDKQVRAWMGEALSIVRERIAPGPGPLADYLDRVIFECEFANQKLFAQIDHAKFDETLVTRLEAVDRSMISLAERAEAVTLETLTQYLDEIEAIFKARYDVAATVQ